MNSYSITAKDKIKIGKVLIIINARMERRFSDAPKKRKTTVYGKRLHSAVPRSGTKFVPGQYLVST